MLNLDIRFSRLLLREVRADVREFYRDNHAGPSRWPAAFLADWAAAWVWKAGRQCWEFHGPKQFYWHGRAANAYEARAKGWQACIATTALQLKTQGEFL